MNGWLRQALASLYSSDDVDADQLMRNADFAMYEAKRSVNRFHLFDAAQDAEVKIRTNEQTRIEQALLQHELVLYYQPKVAAHGRGGRL